MANRAAAAEFRIIPIAGRIGAVIEGLRLTDKLSEETAAAVSAALARHKVVFLRDQHDFDDEAMERLAERMGDPIAHPNIADTKGSRYLLSLEGPAGYASSLWHTDLTFMPAYPAASILRPLQLPATGGDTMFANCAAAYLELPEPLMAMADRLWALHSNDLDFDLDYGGDVLDRVKLFMGKPPEAVFNTEHPIVRVHPETGERVLLTGTFIKRLIGFDARQSMQILALLQDCITRPENCLRWSWSLGDVAIWDNRATQHRVVADYGDEVRHFRRATIQGSLPVGVDGQPSRAIESRPPA
jgi:taurine dioxygenase